MSRWIRALVVAAGLVLASLGAPSSASPIPPSPVVWVVNADGTGAEQIADEVYSEPVEWSPDGRRLLYRAIGTGLHVVDLTTGDATRISRSGENLFDGSVAWSPDGTTIAYTVWDSGGGYFLRAVAPDGSNWRTLLEADNIIGGIDWSPDGTKIAVSLLEDGAPSYRVHVLDVATGELSPLITTSAGRRELEWSPDGMWIAYTERLPSQQASFGIRVIRPDGTDDRQISAGLYAFDFEWAPDASEIAFSVDEGVENSGIYLGSPSSAPRLVIPNGYQASWSPDGTRIAYWDDLDLFTRDRSGNDERTLTDEELRDDYLPIWSPDGTRVAFKAVRVPVYCYTDFRYPLEANIIGTQDDDVIEGTPEADVIAGRGGNDTITGLEGNDVICGGPGDDVIVGSEGDDHLFSEAGSDNVDGTAGNDTVNGGRDNDTLAGGDGIDVVSFSGSRNGVMVDLKARRAEGSGRDSLADIEDVHGSAFADTISGDDRANALSGGATRVWSSEDGDLLVGRGGDDVLRGRIGDDRLHGGLGSDDLHGGVGDDRLNGGPDDDSCTGGPGRDDQRQC